MHRFITSDIHFSHKNIINFCPLSRGYYDGYYRYVPYPNIHHMNEDIIQKWNQDVPARNSVVYIIGDVSFASMEETVSIMNRLNGEKILIKGNHDESYLKNSDFRGLFKSIHDDLEIHAAGVRVHLYHFPIWEWHHIHKGAIHFHGHLHGGYHGIPGRIKDVGMDGNKMRVYNLDKLSQEMLQLDIRTHHQKS